MRAPIGIEGETVTLVLHVQPGAARTEWAGRHGERALRLRLAAPAVEGKANRACVRFLAKAFGVPPSGVAIVHGQTARDKVVTVSPVDGEQWRAFRALWSTP